MAEQIRPRGLPGPELCQHAADEVCDMCDPQGRRDRARLARSSNLARKAALKAAPKPAVRLSGWTWRRLQQACFERAGYLCERCGAAVALNAHHRKLRSQGGRNVLSNLAALCGSGTTGCHGWAHNPTAFGDYDPDAPKLGGYIVPSWANPAARAMFLYDGRLVLLDDEGGYRWQGRTND